MKRVLCITCVLIFCSFSTTVFAADTADRLNNLEDTVQKQSKTIEEQQNTIDSLKESFSNQKDQRPVQKGQEPQQTNQELQQQVQELKEKVDQVVEAQKKDVPSEFNPSIGLVGETIFSYRSKGSDGDGQRPARRV